MPNTEAGKMRKEISEKIRFHRRRIKELLNPLSDNDKEWVWLLSKCEGNAAEEIAEFEKILPRPVVRDGNGKLIKDHTPRDFYMKLQEEIFESFKENFEWFWYKHIGKDSREFSAREHFAEEVADVITVCISYLEAIGYDENKRSEIFAKVNEKNEKRGYFKESK